MTRRALLSMLTLAALDPERLIWRPGAKLISIPAAPKALYFHLDFSPGHQPPTRSLLSILDQYGKRISVYSFPLRQPPGLGYHWVSAAIPPSSTYPRGLKLWPG